MSDIPNYARYSRMYDKQQRSAYMGNSAFRLAQWGSVGVICGLVTARTPGGFLLNVLPWTAYGVYMGEIDIKYGRTPYGGQKC